MKMPPHSTEYLMRKELTADSVPDRYLFVRTGKNRIRIFSKGRQIGSFRLLPYSDQRTVYFYDYRIRKSLRGHGLGKDCFRYILCFLVRSGFRFVKLQVSSSNPAAFAIYSGYGFEIIESVIL